MNANVAGRGPRGPDLSPRLRVASVVAVITGVILLAAAAFVLAYAGIHAIALAAGVSPTLARYYPLIFDAMLVVASAAALALRGGGGGVVAEVRRGAGDRGAAGRRARGGRGARQGCHPPPPADGGSRGGHPLGA